MTKKEFFEYVKNKGLFWSYSHEIVYSEKMDKLLCETVIKYGDIKEIINLFKLYSKDFIQDVWKKNIKYDNRFKKTNYLFATIFLNLKVDNNFFKDNENARIEKIKLFDFENPKNFA